MPNSTRNCNNGVLSHLMSLVTLLFIVILGAVPLTEAACYYDDGDTNCATFYPDSESLVIDTLFNSNVKTCEYIQVGVSTSATTGPAYSITDLRYSLNKLGPYSPITPASIAVTHTGTYMPTPFKLPSATGQNMIYLAYTIPGNNIVAIGTEISVQFICNNDGTLDSSTNLLRISGTRPPPLPSTKGFQTNTIHTAIAGGGGGGDPHMRGPNGERYDFTGQPGGIYSFFSSPWYQVTMQLTDAKTNHARVMVKAGVAFHDVTFAFNTTASPLSEEVNATLGVAGAKVVVSTLNQTEIELCPGHVLTIERASYYIMPISPPRPPIAPPPQVHGERRGPPRLRGDDLRCGVRHPHAAAGAPPHPRTWAK